MATIVDSYAESNFDTEYVIGGYSFYNDAVGQSFTASNSGTLLRIKVMSRSVNSPGGNVTASIYTHSGTYGTSSIPTGSALVTSDSYVATSISPTISLLTFYFSTPYDLVASTQYVLTVNYTGGDVNNYVTVGYDASSTSHGGNACYTSNGSTWNAESTKDLIFKVYIAPIEPKGIYRIQGFQ